MTQEETQQYSREDIKKALGCPKVTFVLGGPASGKGTQCEKIVEEFGYTHISTGDLMRAEMAKGSKLGDEIQKIVTDGGLVPYEITVQVLTQAMLDKPSKNYLIDGFPRALDQALHFEATVCEAQSVLFYDVSEEECIARCMERAKTSGRADDTESTIKKRFTNYVESTKPAIEMYSHFGKVHKIDGERDINEIYEETRKALLPQTAWILGPRGSGKSSIGNALSSCTNMKLIDFTDFVKCESLEGKDDETVVSALIKRLSEEVCPRVLIENFPKNDFQAKFFMKNGRAPSQVFALKCSKDVCQERMFCLGENHPDYLPSAILAKEISDYNNRSKKLLPFLKNSCQTYVIESSQALNQSVKQARKFIEPTIVHIRHSGSENSIDKKEEIRTNLVEQGFIELNVNDLTREEMDRRTDLGLKLQNAYNTGQQVTSDMYIDLLKPVIFSGHESGRDHFLLAGFPETSDQVAAFETTCTSLSGIIFATDEGTVVDVKNNEPSLCNIDTQFSKEGRLKVMTGWNQRKFDETMGSITKWGVVTGRPFSGKTTVAKELAKLTNGHTIDMSSITEEVKKAMQEAAGEDEVEEVPIDAVQNAIQTLIKGHQDAGKNFSYIFDSYTNKSYEEFMNFACEAFGPPSFWLPLSCSNETAGKRWGAKNDSEDVPEEQAEELKADEAAAEAQMKEINEFNASMGGDIKCIELGPTDCSQATTFADLKSKFSAKIILLNHDPRLQVDIPASNLAIKYNMLYLSVPQLIGENIKNNTKLGQKLAASKQEKPLIEAFNSIGIVDPHNEAEFSAAHFDSNVVMEVILQTVTERRSDQSFILLEGVCNSNKLANEEDKLGNRDMDEFFMVEKMLGDIEACVSFTYNKEEEYTGTEEGVKYEEFPEEVVQEAKPADGDVDEGEGEAEAEGEKKVVFNPRDHQWTITNGQSRNMLTMFANLKGNKPTFKKDMRDSNAYGQQAYDAVTAGLNDFCSRVTNSEDDKEKNLYLQVLFSDN